MMIRSFLAALMLSILAAGPALAHTGAGSVSGFAAGFGHPIGGLDHILAMVAVGVLAAQMGGRALWLVPAAFVAMMIAGGLAAVSGIALPMVEIGIVGSVVVLGAVIAFGRKMPVVLAMAVVGAMAVFHGHAHGTEMPVSASGLEYGLGFALATALLHAAGIGAALTAAQANAKIAPLALRASGGAIALAGMALFVA
tara:strand:- start:242 stop:832 length:591 start_codon:yes stop_codon:yes gene_type:complete